VLFEFRHFSAILLDKNREPRRSTKVHEGNTLSHPALPSTVWKG
jgi:hypothetical protein